MASPCNSLASVSEHGRSKRKKRQIIFFNQCIYPSFKLHAPGFRENNRNRVVIVVNSAAGLPGMLTVKTAINYSQGSGNTTVDCDPASNSHYGIPSSANM